MRIIINVSEKDGMINLRLKRDYGSRDHNLVMAAGDRLLGEIGGLLQALQDNSSQEKQQLALGKAARFRSWLKRMFGRKCS